MNPGVQSLALPCTYGAYELLEHLGTGGNAEVYRARRIGAAGFEKPVVVKRLRPDAAKDPRRLALFLQEAKLAAEVTHANVVEVYELGQLPDGDLYMVLELVQGVDLRRFLSAARASGRRLPPWFAVHVCAEILAGLAHFAKLTDAHGRPRGVVHRDITPDNIFLSSLGDVKLADFGSAYDAAQPTDPLAGQVPGKLAYTAPEQLAGEAVDARSDLFSVGAILFELLTLRPPFRAPTQAQVVEQIVSTARMPPSRLASDVPKALDACVLAALDFDRQRRPPDATVMRVILLDLLEAMQKKPTAADVRALMEEVMSAPPATDTSPSFGGVTPGTWVVDLASFATPPAEPAPERDDDADDGVTYAIINPRLRAQAPGASKSESGARPLLETDDLIAKNLVSTIPIPARPSEVETRDIVKRKSAAAAKRSPGFWLRLVGGPGIGPISLEDLIQDVRLHRRSRSEPIEVSGDGERWMPVEAAVAAIAGDDQYDGRLAGPPDLAGALEDHSAVAVLAELAAQQVTGRLLMTNGFDEAVGAVQLDLVDGLPVRAATAESALELPLQLVRQRIVERDTLESALYELLRTGRTLAAILNERVRLDLAAERGRLMAARLEPALAWGAGGFAFQHMEVPESPPFAQGLLSLLPRLLHRAFTIERLRQLLQSSLDVHYTRTARWEPLLRELGLSPVQLQAVDALGRARTLRAAVTASPQGEKFALVMSYLFVELGMVSPQLKVRG